MDLYADVKDVLRGFRTEFKIKESEVKKWMAENEPSLTPTPKKKQAPKPPKPEFAEDILTNMMEKIMKKQLEENKRALEKEKAEYKQQVHKEQQKEIIKAKNQLLF